MDGSKRQSRWMDLAETRIRAPRALRETGRALWRLVAAPWPHLVGVDLSDTSAKMVRVLRRGGRIARVQAAERPISATTNAVEREASIASALHDLTLRLGVRGAPAATSLTGPDVLVRRLSLPEMRRADLLPALTLECRKHVGFPIEDAEIRYQMVGRSEGPAGPTIDLLVAIVKRKAVEDRRARLLEAGLRPVAITLHPVGLLALLDEAGDVRAGEVVAYLDMGANESHIMVLKGREIRFSREFGIGGATFTDALRAIVVPGRGTVELSAEEAEALKRAHGIPTGEEEASSSGRVPLASIGVMIRPILERLVRELWNSFDYVNEQYLGESVSRVVLLGDGSRIRNLSEHLTGVLKIPVERADCSERVMPRSAGPAVDVSDLGLGLALVGREALNFLTPAGAGWPYRVAEAVPQRVAAAAAMALLLSVSLPAEVVVLQERQRVGTLRGHLEELKPEAEAIRRFRAAREEETRVHDLLARLSGGQVLWSYVLRDLSHRVGPEVRLTSLEVSAPSPGAPANAADPAPGREVTVAGLLDTRRARPEEVLGELMQSLSESPVLEQVRLTDCQAVGTGLSSFTLTARIAE
ncbi:MAG TPA: pilus assembly protein PilM [Candidatus Eisenbacteria bacterium]